MPPLPRPRPDFLNVNVHVCVFGSSSDISDNTMGVKLDKSFEYKNNTLLNHIHQLCSSICFLNSSSASASSLTISTSLAFNFLVSCPMSSMCLIDVKRSDFSRPFTLS